MNSAVVVTVVLVFLFLVSFFNKRKKDKWPRVRVGLLDSVKLFAGRTAWDLFNLARNMAVVSIIYATLLLHHTILYTGTMHDSSTLRRFFASIGWH